MFQAILPPPVLGAIDDVRKDPQHLELWFSIREDSLYIHMYRDFYVLHKLYSSCQGSNKRKKVWVELNPWHMDN